MQTLTKGQAPTKNEQLVIVKDDNAYTTSRMVAQIFGKNHKDVLKAIENLKRDCPADFNQRNFAPVKYRDGKGEYRPEFRLTKDGFTMLAMGFTGKKAMEFKISYINAFNQMQEVITKRMYGETATLTEVRKKVLNKHFKSSTKDTVMYHYLTLKTYLGYSRSSMNGRTREKYRHLMYTDSKGLWVDEDFCIMMIRNRTAIVQRQKTLEATPILPENFGQMPLNF